MSRNNSKMPQESAELSNTQRSLAETLPRSASGGFPVPPNPLGGDGAAPVLHQSTSLQSSQGTVLNPAPPTPEALTPSGTPTLQRPVLKASTQEWDNVEVKRRVMLAEIMSRSLDKGIQRVYFGKWMAIAQLRKLVKQNASLQRMLGDSSQLVESKVKRLTEELAKKAARIRDLEGKVKQYEGGDLPRKASASQLKDKHKIESLTKKLQHAEEALSKAGGQASQVTELQENCHALEKRVVELEKALRERDGEVARLQQQLDRASEAILSGAEQFFDASTQLQKTRTTLWSAYQMSPKKQDDVPLKSPPSKAPSRATKTPASPSGIPDLPAATASLILQDPLSVEQQLAKLIWQTNARYREEAASKSASPPLTDYPSTAKHDWRAASRSHSAALYNYPSTASRPSVLTPKYPHQQQPHQQHPVPQNVTADEQKVVNMVLQQLQGLGASHPNTAHHPTTHGHQHPPHGPPPQQLGRGTQPAVSQPPPIRPHGAFQEYLSQLVAKAAL